MQSRIRFASVNCSLKNVLYNPAKRGSSSAIEKSKQKVQPKDDEIKIPRAIPRGPTDILKALSSTVERDHTGPHYRYLDDPFLTPIGNLDKKTFALSKEAGQKTARYFIENYPELFHRDISEPKIEAFTYKEIYDETMEFDEFDLRKSIIRCDVTNSIICYEKLLKDGIPIEKEILYDLLDLVCFYNGEDPPELYPEEHYFQKSMRRPNVVVNTWKDNGFAEKLFEAMEPKNDRAYSSVIMGMAKYHQTERAFSLYRQAIDQGLKLNADCYNGLISVAFYLHSSNDERWKTIVDLLKTMHSNQVAPNIGTLNSVLKQLAMFKFWEKNTEIAKKVFNEFAFKFNIKPSLASYYHLLSNFYRSRQPKSQIIYEIIDRIQDEKFNIQDSDDVHFLSSAMDVAFNLNDVQLAYRIHKMAEKTQHLLGPSVNSNNYYFKFLKLLCLSETIENFMAIYRKYVPHFHTPNIELMENVLKTIKLYKALNYLPEIYDHLRLFYYTYHIDVVENLLSAMNEIQTDDPLLPEFNFIVSDLFSKINLKIAKNQELGFEPTLQWNAKTLSLCLAILNKCQDIEMGFRMVEKMNSIKNEMFDEPDSQALIDFCIMAKNQKKLDHVISCLKFCKDIGKQDVVDRIKEEFQNIQIQDKSIKNKLDKLFQ